MSKQHTPWKGIKTHPKLDTIIIDSNGWDVCHVESAEAAKLIVKACNNHDRLVEALEVTNKALQKITLLTRRDEASLTDLKEAMYQYREIKQLLTELKS